MGKVPVAHSFILETLLDSKIAPLIRVNPMFGCHAIYVGEKIVLITRQRVVSPRDNGMWVIVQPEFRAEVRAQFPSLRPIELFSSMKEGGPTWICLPEGDPSFEDDALAIVEMVIARDPRFGKVPLSASKKAKKKKTTTEKTARTVIRKVASAKGSKKVAKKAAKKVSKKKKVSRSR